MVIALWGFAYPVAATQVSETETLLREAQSLRVGGFNIKVVEVLKKALTMAQGDEILSALVLNDLGSALQQIGRLSEARTHLNLCIELAHRKGRTDIEAAAATNLGNIDVVEQHPQQAIASYQRSAGRREESRPSSVSATRAEGTVPNTLRGVISPSQVGAPEPPTSRPRYRGWFMSTAASDVREPSMTERRPFVIWTLFAPMYCSLQMFVAVAETGDVYRRNQRL